jgi:HK97 gp10 family phage protein
MASNDFDISVQGLEECCANLDKMPVVLAQKAIQPALVAACAPVLQALASTTPVLTGDLLQHLTFQVEMAHDQKGGTASIGFGTDDHLARWIEYGHREVGHEPKLKEEGFKSARPFMRPATEESADASIEAFAASIEASVDAGLDGKAA